jgi:hypothetical protein
LPIRWLYLNANLMIFFLLAYFFHVSFFKGFLQRFVACFQWR